VREGARGGGPAVTRTIGSLQRSAGNTAVTELLTAQRDTSDEDAAEEQAAATSEASQAEGELAGGEGATELDAGTTGTGQSWTKVGPPSDSTYTVSGTLRQASEAVAARPEAGSVTSTPSLDTDPPVEAKDGSQKIPAARVTVAQVMELPVWSSREGPKDGKPTPNQEAEWTRFHGAISKHEAGHVGKDKTAYADAHTKIKGKSPTDGNAAFDTITTQADTDNDTYDATTDHGRNEGTKINPNIDEVTKVP
jgi:hypothetical protein